jgi:nucleotide-binding universal stress UspA family protein
MKRFNKILFVNDFNKEPTPAFERAVKLAKHNQASLTMVEIFEELPPEIKDSVSPSSLIEYRNAVEAESLNGINNLIIPFKEDGVRFNSKVLWGTPFIEIIREVIRNDHDLVMVSPRKESKIKTMLFGNRIMRLMRKCPCPVWAIKPTEKKSYNKIMAAVDPNPIDEEHGSLNVKIMEMATSLAYREQSELHVVSCWEPFSGDSLKYRSMLSEDDLIGINNETRNMARQRLDALLKKSDVDVDDLPCRVHLLNGEPDDIILEVSNKEGVDLVVMGTISRTGIPGLFIGNTAEKILQKLNCSVLAVKPDGFKTPVRLET